MNKNIDNEEQFCGCAKNHKILDESNARIVGGKEVMPNSLPWQAFIRIVKVKSRQKEWDYSKNFTLDLEFVIL